jgi:hypothetical protein
MATTPDEKETKETFTGLDQLPTVENRIEEVDATVTGTNETPLRPVDTGFGAWSFVSKLGFLPSIMLIFTMISPVDCCLFRYSS